ncbi:UDP-N-acetylmuramate dehydrogenase [Paenibacillus dendritiformis]|uniref:UDP-N-acetylmuramate dehydrogenase n=1 Tax=Paenibacillus dendritiformis TaxID=130049 RepID=UPI0018CCF6A3|nr:FAD-binding protein [Paenibacillus dendritiformis]MBG9794926.1 UDP-N-acetylmuramate dehydrogenase [Paenibacillus dendritiformis]
MNDRQQLFHTLCKRQVRLAEHSSYGIGGEADYFAMPETAEQLMTILEGCKTYGMEYFVFGMGTNILFPERPRKGTVFISLKNFAEIRQVDGSAWFISSGLPLSMLSVAGLIWGTSGLHFTYLLPGCVGAGIYMNAKYHDDQMGDKIEKVYYVDVTDPALSLQVIRAEDCRFSYKQSIFQQKPWIIVGAEIRVPEPDEPAESELGGILERYKAGSGQLSSLSQFYSFFSNEVKGLELRHRAIPGPLSDIDRYRTGNRHFTSRSCGSFFKNNYAAGASIGALVDRLNLKGLAHGGALISPYHGNMILNHRDATASDILYLKDLISEGIYRHFGFIPEPEVVIVPEDK